MADDTGNDRRALVLAVAGLVLLGAALIGTRVEIPTFVNDVPAHDAGGADCPSVADEWGTPREVWSATCQARFTQAELLVLVATLAGLALLGVAAASLLPRVWRWTGRAEAHAHPVEAAPPPLADRGGGTSPQI